MKKDEQTAYAYEDRVDDIILDYFKGKEGYNVSRREGLNRIDYNVTHEGKDILLEVKTRQANSTDFPTAWIRKDKVEAMERISEKEGKPAWVMYIYTGDGKFFLSDVEELKTYGTTTVTVFNPIKIQDKETNVVIPLDGKKFYDIYQPYDGK